MSIVPIAAHARVMIPALVLALDGQLLQAQQQAAVSVPPSVLERYVGEYVYPSGTAARVVLRGDTLYREIPGQRVALVPISETRFRMGPVFTAEFVLDPAGGVTKVVSDGVAIEYRLPRFTYGAVAPAPPVASAAPEAAAVRVPVSVLGRYVGEYEYLPGQMARTDLFIVFRLRGDRLTREVRSRQVAGPQQETVLTPISETRFRVGATSLTMEFVIDQAGEVTAVMGSGSQQMQARRARTP